VNEAKAKAQAALDSLTASRNSPSQLREAAKNLKDAFNLLRSAILGPNSSNSSSSSSSSSHIK